MFCGLLISAQTISAQTISAQTTPAPANEPAPPAYTQALQALQTADLPRARQLLQQVIQEHPQWAGAWLDLALLSLQQGQTAQAQELLLALQERFAPLPPAIAQGVQQLLQQAQQQLQHPSPATTTTTTTTTAQAQHILAIAAGQESNANAGLQFSTLTLNLPEGDTLVTLDPSSQALSAQTLRAAWAYAAQKPLSQGTLSWQIQSQARQYSHSPLNNLELLAQATLSHSPLPGRTTLGWQHIWLNGRTAYHTPILRWQHDTAPGPHCGWQQHIQLEARHNPQASHLDTHWQAWRGTWRCQRGNQRTQIYLQAARETGDHTNRPGGNSQHRQWGLQHEWQQPLQLNRHSLLLRLDRLRTQDTTTYSPLLDNARPRQLSRTDLGLSWTGPIPGPAPWQWTLALQKTTQKSNIAYFRQTNNTIETSIWRAW